MADLSVENHSARVALAPREIAARLGVSKSFVYEQIATGCLPYVRLGVRRIVVELSELEEYLRLRRWGAVEAAQRCSSREERR